MLIALIDQLPRKMVEEISPRTLTLKRWLKAPMVLLVWSTAIFAGQNLCMFKAFGEILTSHDFWKMPYMASFIFLSGCAGGLIQMLFLNIAMRYYNNLDIMPVYQSLILIMMLICGWVLLDEIEYYELSDMLGIIGSSVLIIIGIKVITMKTSVVTQIKKRRTSIASDSVVLDLDHMERLDS